MYYCKKSTFYISTFHLWGGGGEEVSKFPETNASLLHSNKAIIQFVQNNQNFHSYSNRKVVLIEIFS